MRIHIDRGRSTKRLGEMRCGDAIMYQGHVYMMLDEYGDEEAGTTYKLADLNSGAVISVGTGEIVEVLDASIVIRRGVSSEGEQP